MSITAYINADATVQGFSVCEHCGLLTKTENKRCRACRKITTTCADMEDVGAFIRYLSHRFKGGEHGLKSNLTTQAFNLEKNINVCLKK